MIKTSDNSTESVFYVHPDGSEVHFLVKKLVAKDATIARLREALKYALPLIEGTGQGINLLYQTAAIRRAKQALSDTEEKGA